MRGKQNPIKHGAWQRCNHHFYNKNYSHLEFAQAKSSMKYRLPYLLALTALLASGTFQTAHAEEKVLNIYSARHYSGDAQLYEGFSKATGIQIKRVDADDAGILQRLKAEGSASPADVILLVDASHL